MLMVPIDLQGNDTYKSSTAALDPSETAVELQAFSQRDRNPKERCKLSNEQQLVSDA